MAKTSKIQTPERRERGTGTVVKRAGKWYARIRRNGKDEYSEAFASQRGAEKAREKLAQGHNPKHLPTVEEFVHSLLENEYVHRYDPETLKVHETFYRLRLNGSVLGRMRIDQVKKGDVQAFIDKLRPYYKRCSLRRLVSCLHTAFAIAEEDKEWIEKNPVKKIRLPESEPRQPKALDARQSHELPKLLFARSERLAAMVTVLLDTGMRPGELCAITWSDIDETRSTLRIAHTMSRERKLKSPKDNEIRFVDLTPDAISAIKAQPKVSRFVFTTDEGGPIRPDWFGQQLRRHRDKIGFPGLSLRDLRKTFASIGQSIDLKATQDLLGHSTPEMTLGVYAESSPSGRKKAVAKMARKVGSRGIFEGRVQDRGSRMQHASTSEPV